MSRVCSCCTRLHSHHLMGGVIIHGVSALTVTAQLMPYCHFTADCTLISDQTVRQIKQCPSRKLVGDPSWWEARAPRTPLDPALVTRRRGQARQSKSSTCFIYQKIMPFDFAQAKQRRNVNGQTAKSRLKSLSVDKLKISIELYINNLYNEIILIWQHNIISSHMRDKQFSI